VRGGEQAAVWCRLAYYAIIRACTKASAAPQCEVANTRAATLPLVMLA
jgi:hypothetical protein